LHQLAKERIIEIKPGQGSKLLSRVSRKPNVQNPLVAVITHHPLHSLELPYQGLNEMQAELAKRGFATEVVLCQAQGRAAQRFIENYLKRNHVFCCVLLSVSKELQLWFSTHQIPALVLGSCHPNVTLPSLDFDNHSVCRHATNMFINRGHCRLCLLIPNSGLFGDLVSEQGFLEAIDAHSRVKVEGRILHHDGSATSISAKLDTAFAASSPPTALLVANAHEVFIVMSYLLSRGRSVPGSVSLIVRDHTRIFEIVQPTISHYRPEAGAFVRRLCRLILKMVEQGRLEPRRCLLVPKFFSGGTVKKLD